MKNISILFGTALLATSIACAPLSRPPTQREQTAAVGGLAGGAGGAIIGSFAGSAVAGGLFGIPLGAVTGWYVGDYMARQERMAQLRMEEREEELNRLRRENERLRREEDQPARGARLSSRQGSGQQTAQSEQSITTSQQGRAGTASSQRVTMSRAEVRQAQEKLNDMGFHAGHVDGILGPNTKAALRSFQQSKGLEATGQLNQETMTALGLGDSSRGTEAQPRSGDDQAGQTSQESSKPDQQK